MHHILHSRIYHILLPYFCASKIGEYVEWAQSGEPDIYDHTYLKSAMQNANGEKIVEAFAAWSATSPAEKWVNKIFRSDFESFTAIIYTILYGACPKCHFDPACGSEILNTDSSSIVRK